MRKSIEDRLAKLERTAPGTAIPGGRPIRLAFVNGAPVYTRTDAPGWDSAIVDAALAGLRVWGDAKAAEVRAAIELEAISDDR